MRLWKRLARLKTVLDWRARERASDWRRHRAFYQQARGALTAWMWNAWIR